VEIHAPGQPVHSSSETFRYLAIITAGVLIALALEGAATWFEHRRLVREATTNLRNEMAENVREVEGLFVNLVKERRSLEHANDLAQMLLDQRKIENMTLGLEFHAAELKDASRTTAEITGAFGHMEYAEVERFAAVYGLQATFNRAQDRANESFVTALAGAGLLANPDKADAAQVRQWKSDCPDARRAHRRGADRAATGEAVHAGAGGSMMRRRQKSGSPLGPRAAGMSRRRFVTRMATAGAAAASGGSAVAQSSNRVRGFDHVAVPMQNTDAMLAFYRRLGFEVRESAAAYSVYIGNQMINFHRPTRWQDAAFTLRAPAARPPCGDFCFVWDGTAAALKAWLDAASAAIVEGPVPRQGGRKAEGSSVYIRDPDGNLLEFMIYP
jgi:catechol 2,3-dioxygenase-like lactoylglutathione lyase family enzyme